MGISLANKSQLLFGCAVLVILAAALSVPWFLTPMIVREGQVEAARQLADAWLADLIQLDLDEVETREEEQGTEGDRGADADEDLGTNSGADTPRTSPTALHIAYFRTDELASAVSDDPFLAAAVEHFQGGFDNSEHFATVSREGRLVYRYARAVRGRDAPDHRAARWSMTSANPIASLVDASPTALRGVLLIDRGDTFAQSQLLRSRMYIIAAGLVAGLLAVLVFYFILTKLILSPVRKLRETAEHVQQGDLGIRATIETGDEFEQLSEAFNAMLDQVEQSQAKLRAMNESLDLKLTELSEANVGLYESNRLKSEFLANVSHELRTPLNSIIGFAELLSELAQAETHADPKRIRYLSNILTSGRSLLEMINELLQMARIEAGRVEVNVEPTSISDLVEGLLTIMRPQAESRRIDVRAHIAQNLPMVETDPGKLQQILYNFLSNAVKFTPQGGTVTITADRVKRQDNSVGVRLGVADTGPGIPYDMQESIFEKFRQVDASHTREHAGTGLGLAICRELAELLGASVSLVSEPGRGATFFVDLPLTYQAESSLPLMDRTQA